MKAFMLCVLMAAVCSAATVLHYDGGDTTPAPQAMGTSKDWAGVWFELDNWADSTGYTGTFRVDTLEIWLSSSASPIQVAIFSDSMVGSSGPQNIVWETTVTLPSPIPHPLMVACGEGVEMSNFFWVGVADNYSANISFLFSTQWSPYGVHSYYWPPKELVGGGYERHLLIRAHGEWVPYQALQSSTWGCIKANLGN